MLPKIMYSTVEESRIRKAGGWVEFNRVNGKRMRTFFLSRCEWNVIQGTLPFLGLWETSISRGIMSSAQRNKL